MLRKKFGEKNLSEKKYFYDWFRFQETVKRTHNNNINNNKSQHWQVQQQ